MVSLSFDNLTVIDTKLLVKPAKHVLCDAGFLFEMET